MILDQTKAARATLEKARARFHDNFFSEDLLARVYSREKDFTNALSHFTSAELLAKITDPKLLNEQFYFDLGAAYERKGDFEQAEQAFNRSLEYKPDFAEALNYYGYMLADRGVQLPRAREMIEKAVKAEPKNAAFLDSLGWVLYKLNQPAAALPQLLKAIELSEEPDATLYEHLGDIRAALKETAKAQEAWRKSLAIEPNPQIQKKLESLARP